MNAGGILARLRHRAWVPCPSASESDHHHSPRGRGNSGGLTMATKEETKGSGR